MKLNTHTVIIKVTNDCNLNCKYCFVEKSVPRNRIIAIETIKRLFDELEVYASQPVIHLTWHGGEPMLAGIDFYKDVINLQKNYKKRFINAIQTNGILIDEKYARFFKENSFLIGISLDGPKGINDLARADKTDKGTFERVFKNFLTLTRLEVNFGVLATIARHNVNHTKELYTFFKDKRLSVNFSVLYPSGNAMQNIDFLAISSQEYAKFLIDMTDIWINDSQPIELRSVELIINNLLSYGHCRKTCTFCENCHESFLALGPTGDLYPCCLFQGFHDFRYGNIHQISLSQIPKSTVWGKLENRVEYIKGECSNCEIEEYCHGGCSFNAFANYGELNRKDYYCNSHKKAFPILLEILEKKLGGLKQ